jgi:hypothetical protein
MKRVPDFKISAKEKISLAFLERNVFDFNSAAAFVRDLPYRRNKNKSELLSVLSENCGTCSSKHVLLKLLAEENNFDLRLCIGIFRMSVENTPAVAATLIKNGLNYIPEAHCYLNIKTRW